MKFDFLSKENMNQNSIIVFVCEHGAAKSILAAAHFNKLAGEKGLNLQAVARGTNPDQALSPQVVTALHKDGLAPTESAPRKLSLAEAESAQQIIAFCQLQVEYHEKASIEFWDDMPPVSENYEQARDAILERINNLINTLA
jgi:arsenate reductase (thioredoxin)